MANTTKFRAGLFLPPAGQKSRSRRDRSVEDNPAVQAIWDIVGAIPRGAASSYGAVARAAGLPGRARLAGYALRLMSPDLHLPWHRVVSAGGRVAFPKGSAKYREQVRLLRADGVTVKDGRVDGTCMIDLDVL